MSVRDKSRLEVLIRTKLRLCTLLGHRYVNDPPPYWHSHETCQRCGDLVRTPESRQPPESSPDDHGCGGVPCTLPPADQEHVRAELRRQSVRPFR